MSVLSLAEAKQHLNITNTANDDEVVAFRDAAEAFITRRIGPLEPTVVTRRVVRYGNSLVLPVVPVLSLTSVSPDYGSPVTVGDLRFDADSGVVSYTAATATFGRYLYTVVYTAGWPDGQLPADLLMAVKELLRHLWTSQRGSGVRPGSRPPEGAANTLPGASYLLPIRVEQLLANYQLPGIA